MARKWKWGVLFSGDNLTLAETIDFAAKAEDAGAESLWTTELGRDAFVPLAGMAARCKRARLGTGVAVFARPPALTEISAMSMAELTDGPLRARPRHRAHRRGTRTGTASPTAGRCGACGSTSRRSA